VSTHLRNGKQSGSAALEVCNAALLRRQEIAQTSTVLPL